MDILPAIDLKDGKAVRLSKGLMESAKKRNSTTKRRRVRLHK